LASLYVSPQQYAYARVTGKSVVIVAFNNDEKAEQFTFDVAQVGLKNGTSLNNRLGNGSNVVNAGRIELNLPPRSVSILVPSQN
jgi:O-glycosyl hydrolase